MIVKVNIPKKIFDRLANKDRELTIKDIDIALGALCKAKVVSDSYTWEEDTRPECSDCCYCVCKTNDGIFNEKFCAMSCDMNLEKDCICSWFTRSSGGNDNGKSGND